MDFGDVIFFIVFVIIIITNIMKQLKKTQNKTAEKPRTETQPKKKSGWKNVLEEMLEEARRQMENKAEPESAGEPLKHPTGWEDIVPENRTPPPPPKGIQEKSKVYHSHLSPHRPIIRETSHMRDKLQFQPECMKCNEPMKKITDLEIKKQTGLIYCDHCGAQHKYRIVDGELRLKLASEMRKSGIATERRYRSIDKENEIPVITLQDDSPSFGDKIIPPALVNRRPEKCGGLVGNTGKARGVKGYGNLGITGR